MELRLIELIVELYALHYCSLDRSKVVGFSDKQLMKEIFWSTFYAPSFFKC